MNKTPDRSDAEATGRMPLLAPDAQGQAALLLVESVLHALVERGVLTAGDAMAAVQVAIEVKRDLAAFTGEAEVVRDESLRLLVAIEHSFAAYGDGDGRTGSDESTSPIRTVHDNGAGNYE